MFTARIHTRADVVALGASTGSSEFPTEDALIFALESVEVWLLCASSVKEAVEIAITKSARSKILQWNIGVTTFWSSEERDRMSVWRLSSPADQEAKSLDGCMSPNGDDSQIRTVSYTMLRFAI